MRSLSDKFCKEFAKLLNINARVFGGFCRAQQPFSLLEVQPAYPAVTKPTAALRFQALGENLPRHLEEIHPVFYLDVTADPCIVFQKAVELAQECCRR